MKNVSSRVEHLLRNSKPLSKSSNGQLTGGVLSYKINENLYDDDDQKDLHIHYKCTVNG